MDRNSPQTNGNGGNYVRAEEPNAVATDPSLAALHFMQLQAALQGIEQFDGKEPPLRTFLYDIEQGLSLVPEVLEASYTKGILRKLRGNAREAVEGRIFETTDALIKFLRETFAPAGLTLSQCQAQLAQLRMEVNESVSDFIFRTQRLVGKSKAALLAQEFPEAQIPTLMSLIKATAFEGFRKGLRPDIELRVSMKNPQTLEDALEFARKEEQFLLERHRVRENLGPTPRTNGYSPSTRPNQGYLQQGFQRTQARVAGPSQFPQNAENSRPFLTPREYGAPRPPIQNGYRPPRPNYADTQRVAHCIPEKHNQILYDYGEDYNFRNDYFNPPDYREDLPDPNGLNDLVPAFSALCARCSSELDNLPVPASVDNKSDARQVTILAKSNSSNEPQAERSQVPLNCLSARQSNISASAILTNQTIESPKVVMKIRSLRNMSSQK